MKTGLITLTVGLAMLMLASATKAVTYQASMNHAEWRLEMSPFECRLWQPIPTYGDAVFQFRAGDEQRFYLNPHRRSMLEGKANIASAPPIWDESRPMVNLGKVDVAKSGHSLKLDAKIATRLLNELYGGMSPQFTRQSWYGDESIYVALTSVHFRKAYAQYRDCLTTLLPVNFEQIARSRIHFKTAKWELTAASKARLDHVITYVKADPSVTGFYIDGHTDNVGARIYNLELSKQRATVVSNYLSASGIDEALITTRYHGEGYPAAGNNSANNRGKNRRVTLRLEREGV